MRGSLAGLVVAAATLGAFAQGGADGKYVFELGPEAADAQKQGAAEVEAAQKLAKAKQFADAARKLEALSQRLPASVHDCNLALAYLRASNITAAQLAWDLSRLRNGARPKWCTGDVSTQLSEALRAARYVPTALDITPVDALVEVNGVALRGLRTVWLPPQPNVFTVSAPGLVTQTKTFAVGGTSASVTITLEAPVAVVTPDAGVAEPMAMPDAAMPPPSSYVPDAAVPQVEQPDPLLRVGGDPVGFRALSLTVAIIGWVGAGVLGYFTYDAANRANQHYPSDPAFKSIETDYSTYATATLGAAGLGAIATVFYIYFRTQGDAIIPKPGKIKVGVDGNGGIGISYSGTFGGSP